MQTLADEGPAEFGRPRAEHGARTYNGGPETEPPAGSRGRATGQTGKAL